MISNERASPYGRRPYSGQGYGSPQYSHYSSQPPRPPVHEDTLKSAELQIERKFFTFALKENPRGRLLRITEDIGGRRNAIIVPSTGLADFKRILEEMIKVLDEQPPAAPPAEPEP